MAATWATGKRAKRHWAATAGWNTPPSNTFNPWPNAEIYQSTPHNWVYLSISDLRPTDGETRADKPGAIPAHFDAILDRLEIDRDAWLDTVQHFGSRFLRVAGSVKRLMQAAREAGQHWFQGKAAAQHAYQSA